MTLFHDNIVHYISSYSCYHNFCCTVLSLFSPSLHSVEIYMVSRVHYRKSTQLLCTGGILSDCVTNTPYCITSTTSDTRCCLAITMLTISRKGNEITNNKLLNLWFSEFKVSLSLYNTIWCVVVTQSGQNAYFSFKWS